MPVHKPYARFRYIITLEGKLLEYIFSKWSSYEQLGLVHRDGSQKIFLSTEF